MSVRWIDPRDLAEATGDRSAVASPHSSRRREVTGAQCPAKPDAVTAAPGRSIGTQNDGTAGETAPTWGTIAAWAFVALALVPLFLLYCGSL